MKLLCTAFEATLREYEITGLHLAEGADVSAAMISKFKNDATGITTDSLEKIIATFDDEEFEYWISQIIALRGIEDFTQSAINIQTLVSLIDGEAAADFLISLAIRMRTDSKMGEGELAIEP